MTEKLINKDGRPTRAGWRQKLTKAFLQDLHDRWIESGPGVLKILSIENPLQLAQLVASTLPRQDELHIGLLQGMSEEELEAVEARIVELQSLTDEQLKRLTFTTEAPEHDARRTQQDPTDNPESAPREKKRTA
jgi:hypothetical protein